MRCILRDARMEHRGQFPPLQDADKCSYPDPDVAGYIAGQGLEVWLSASPNSNTLAFSSLPHRYPFYWIPISRASTQHLTALSVDGLFELSDVNLLW